MKALLLAQIGSWKHREQVELLDRAGFGQTEIGTLFRASHAAKPKNAHPGISDIRLTFLSDLTEIIRTNSRLFLPAIPDTNNWIGTLEAIRVPRNLVGHMNFPNSFDKTAIDSAYSQLPALLKHLATNSVPVLIPK